MGANQRSGPLGNLWGPSLMAELSEARRRANKKWNDKNKDKQRIYQYRSNAKKFIRDLATHDDLIKFQEMIQERLDNEQ